MAINLRLGSRVEQRDRIDSLPHTIELKGSKFMGAFLMIFSSFWGGMPGFFFFRSIFTGNFKPELLFLLIFIVIGSALFIFGLSQFFSSKRWVITLDHVNYVGRGLFKNKSWSEPLSNYAGIMKTEEKRSSGGQNSSTYIVYVLKLHHKDKEKVVTLYESRVKSGFRNNWERLGKLFEMPCLEQGDNGIVVRDIEDLDKSVKELVNENKVDVKFNPALRPPNGVDLNRLNHNEWIVTQTAKQIRMLYFAPIMFGIPLLFMYIGFKGGAPVFFGYAGTLFLILIIIGLLNELISSPRFYITSSGFRSSRVYPWKETKGTVLNADEIESIEIKKGDSLYKVIELSTDNKQIKIGAGLSVNSLTWLKECILFKITS